MRWITKRGSMTKVIITYDTLYEILRREKFRNELQLLDADFFDNVLNYLNEKSVILDSQKNRDSIFSSEYKKTERTIQNTKKLLNELYEKRESKIANLALLSSRTSLPEEDLLAMLPEERRLYDELLTTLNIFRKGIILKLLSDEKPDINQQKDIKSDIIENKKSLVRFLHAVPKFVGVDMNIYGPYDNHDIANLPSNIANVLISKERAEEVMVGK